MVNINPMDYKGCIHKIKEKLPHWLELKILRNGALLYVLTLHQVALYNEQSWPMSKALYML